MPSASAHTLRQPHRYGRDNVEIQLRDLWCSLLGHQNVSVHDDFFAVGGHSLLAMRVSVGVRRLFGVDLSPADLLEAATVAELAVIVRRGADGAHAPRSLVRLETGKGLAPVYALPPVSGSILLYPNVARAVGPDVPFYALQSVGVEPGTQPLDSVETITRAFLDEMRTVHPVGAPWQLLGYSMGGIIAYEAARQLRASGEEVGLVGLFDTRTVVERTSDPDFAVRALLWRTLRIEVDMPWLRSLPQAEQARVLVERAVAAGSVPEDFDSERLMRMIAMYGYNLEALASYELTTYDGEVTLFRVSDRRLEPKGSPEDLGWGAHASHVRVHPVPGDHFSMIDPGNVETLGAAVREHLTIEPR